MSKDCIDLHVHSFFSDGMRGPREIIEWAKKLRLKVISLADHNTIFGLKEMIRLGREAGIKVIPGIEIYADYKNYNLHLLGYDFDVNNSCLEKTLLGVQRKEIQRVKKIIYNFQKLGFKISWLDVQKRIGSKFIDVGHIASVLLDFPENIALLKKELGNLPDSKKQTIQVVIKQYLGLNKPAYVKLPCLDLKQAINMIHQANGFVVLGHPGQTLGYLKENLLKDLIKNNLDGLEAISRYHSMKQDKYYQKLAQKYHLKITGGTDWHDYGNENRKGKRLKIPYSIYLNLL